ncbi:MAG: hypothetical protein WBC33_11310 [Conexibacter sp.]
MLAAAFALAVPTTAPAKRHRHLPPAHDRGLTIAAAPNPITTGEPVLVYGQLDGPDHANRTITLWHNIAGVPGGFTRVTQTTTDANGFWSIQRAPGVVITNRAWFATAGRGTHSRTIVERVHAAVTLDTPAGELLTRSPITFTGTVAPDHSGQRVILQQQVGDDGDRWRTIDHGRIGPGSHFAIVHRFRQPGDRTLRAVFRGDRRNLRGESTPISLTIQQTQVEGFTIGASATSIDFGQSVTISGVLTGGASTSVTLFGRNERGGGMRPLAAGTTDATGAYAFVQSPTRNTIYKVKVTTDPSRTTAPLFVGVHSVVSIASSATEGQVGQTIEFTGTVQPDKSGHAIFLQRLDGGVWHTVEVARVGAGSSYALSYTLDTSGSIQFRALVPGGPANQRGISSAVTVAVIPSPASALPGGELPAAS